MPDLLITPGTVVDGTGNPRCPATYDRPREQLAGIEYVIVNGTVVLDRGKHTEHLPGQPLWYGRRG